MKYKIEIDPCPSNPRSEDMYNPVHFAFKHRRYDLGDVAYKDLNCDSLAQLEGTLRKEYHAAVLEKVSATDHSGFSMYLGDPMDQWDSGVLGYAFVTEEELAREFNGDPTAAKTAIECELDIYKAYVNGEVYQAVIMDDAGEVQDSCGGFYSEEEARDWAEYYIDQED